MGGGSKPDKPAPLPPPPPPAPPPPTPAASPEAQRARKRKEEQARLAYGRAGTIKTGPLGLMDNGLTNKKSLLGI